MDQCREGFFANFSRKTRGYKLIMELLQVGSSCKKFAEKEEVFHSALHTNNIHDHMGFSRSTTNLSQKQLKLWDFWLKLITTFIGCLENAMLGCIQFEYLIRGDRYLAEAFQDLFLHSFMVDDMGVHLSKPANNGHLVHANRVCIDVNMLLT